MDTTKVFIAADNILSPIGKTTDENIAQLKQGVSGIRLHDNTQLSDQPFYASLFNTNANLAGNDKTYTRFEQLLIASIEDALKGTSIQVGGTKALLIISSTKGNIDLLENNAPSEELKNRIALHRSAKLVADHFKMANTPMVISNACISGLLGIIIGSRLIRSGQYEHVIVSGADIISKFVLSGFQSFMAVSPEPCKPFDADRKGITLGEAAATIVLTSDRALSNGVKVMDGYVSNDANHISAPSRTGDELSNIITRAIEGSGLSPENIGFVSAHGTATAYNDEMEAKAIAHAELGPVPVNSLKGFYGHTLGAAGLVESIVSLHSMKENIVLPTPGFQNAAIENALNITKTILHIPIQHFIKTASGFGGCNAALVFSKD